VAPVRVLRRRGGGEDRSQQERAECGIFHP